MATRATSTNALPFELRERKFLNAFAAEVFAEIDAIKATYMLADGSNADLPTTDPDVAGALWDSTGDAVVSANS